MRQMTSKRIDSHRLCSFRRQKGVSLIPALITICIFTLLATQVVIPNQNRNIRETNINAVASSVEQLIQASYAFRAASSPPSWPTSIGDDTTGGDLVPKYLPVFNNFTPWGGTWAIGNSGSFHFKTDTNNQNIARALVQKIGSYARIGPTNNEEVEIFPGIIAPPTIDSLNITQDITVGRNISTQNITVDRNIITQDIRVDRNISTQDITVGRNISTQDITVESNIITQDIRVDRNISTQDITVGRNIILTGKIMASDGTTILLDGNSLPISPSFSPFASTDKTHYHSSKRFKQNIHPLETMIENIYQLKPVSYDYKEAFKQYKTPNAANSEIGLIAEQVLPLIPEITLLDNDKIMGIDYPKLSILLLSAIQELKAEVTTLKTNNQQLQQQMDDLNIESLNIEGLNSANINKDRTDHGTDE